MSEQAAGALADRYGLTRGQADTLRQGVEKLSNAAAKGIDLKIKITDDASKALDDVKLKAEKIDDKTVRISGDNTDLMQKIADATGATIDPKTGKLDLDKTQFDYAMAIAAGATIDPKTGLLQGDTATCWPRWPKRTAGPSTRKPAISMQTTIRPSECSKA